MKFYVAAVLAASGAVVTESMKERLQGEDMERRLGREMQRGGSRLGALNNRVVLTNRVVVGSSPHHAGSKTPK